MSYELAQALGKSYGINTPIRILLLDARTKEFLEKLHMTDIPNQYKDLSIKDMVEKFAGHVSEEQLKQLDEKLAKFSD